jgi:hypothetical protein
MALRQKKPASLLLIPPRQQDRDGTITVSISRRATWWDHEGRIDAKDHRHRRHGFKAAGRKGDHHGNNIHSGDFSCDHGKERGERNPEHRHRHAGAQRPAQLRRKVTPENREPISAPSDTKAAAASQ